MKFRKGLHNILPAVGLCIILGLVLTGYRAGGFSQFWKHGTGYERTNATDQSDFDDFCMSVFKDELSGADTLDLHYTLLEPEKYGITHSEVTLGECQLEHMICNMKDVKALRAQLLTFDRAALTEAQQLTYDVLLETLNTSLLGEGLELYEQPLAPTIGVQAQLPVLLAEYSFHSPEDIEEYLALLSQIDRYYAEILEFERQKTAAGLGPSDATIDAVIESCEGYLRCFDVTPEIAQESNLDISSDSLLDPKASLPQSASSNFLQETFDSRMRELEQNHGFVLTDEQKSDFTARHNAAITNHFIPAYQSLIEGMRSLKGRGINDGGLANWKNGRAYYTYLLKSGPGLSYTVPELKSAINNRMQHDIDALEQLFLKYPDLEDQLSTASFSLTDPIEILEHLKTQMSNDFPLLTDCDYEICYVPNSLEETLSPAFYLTAPLDNTNHNVIYINNGYTDATSDLYTTLAHEGFPGHLYLTVYNRTNAQTPLLSILSCSGANEGWATYVENYACTLDNGLPPGVGEYRALVRSLSLCVYGALDVGINYDGWDKEYAANYISSFFQTDNSTIDEIWQTMIDNPTNYLEYCGGYLEIMEMRETAESELGENFSPYEFHRFLLDIGPVPFSVIRSHFQTWLKEQQTYITT